MTCWAKDIGDCGGGPSKEHPISKAFLGPGPVVVSGLPWCREPKTISAEALGSNVLCRNHNNALSDIDDAGTDAFRRFQQFLQVRGVRLDEHRRQIRKRHAQISGAKLERWLLKALIGLARMPRGEATWYPPPDWVGIAFGLHDFQPRCGLYIGGFEEARVLYDRNRWGIQYLSCDGNAIDGACFDFNGWPLTLSFVPLDDPSIKYRPAFVQDRHHGTTQQSIAFHWDNPLTP